MSPGADNQQVVAIVNINDQKFESFRREGC